MQLGDDAVLQLGDPRLRRIAKPVEDPLDPQFVAQRERLHIALAAFRERFGFGRAIAAPQLNFSSRFLAVNLGDGPVTLINPRISARSDATFTLWDDCMSFPELLVRVRRHRSVDVSFEDEAGVPQCWTGLDWATSELLQHEIDHLDGVLAVDRAIDPSSIVKREVFAEHRRHFAESVDELGCAAGL